MNHCDYRNQLKRYLVYPLDMYDTDFDNVNVFQYPIKQIFFWSDIKNKSFFSIYEYLNRYVVIYDFSNDIIEMFNEDTCDDILCEIVLYLYKNAKIYDNLGDINIKSISMNIGLKDAFDYFYTNYVSKSVDILANYTIYKNVSLI